MLDVEQNVKTFLGRAVGAKGLRKNETGTVEGTQLQREGKDVYIEGQNWDKATAMKGGRTP